jgi:PAS domain S-box-containing protein
MKKREYNHEPRRSLRKQRERACKCRKTAYSRRLLSKAFGGLPEHEKARLFDSSIVGTAQEAVDFITNILQSSTEYSVIAKDLTGKILLWNEGARRLYGYEPDEVVGKANSSILHAPQDIKAGVPAQIMQAALTIGFLLISKDISDEIRLTQYARSLIEASVDPLVTISPEGKITDANEATVDVTGALREKLIGTDFANYFTEPEKAREGYQQAFAKGFVTDYPLTIRHIDGRLSHVLYNASVYKDVNGKVLGVFAAARDVTPLKKAEHGLNPLNFPTQTTFDFGTVTLSKEFGTLSP